MVFGCLVAGLAVAGLGAVAVYTGSIQPGFLDRGYITPSTDRAAAALPPPPCPPEGALPAAYGSITVSVYNASDRNGLAGTTADVLAGRGFSIGTVADYPGTAPAVPVEVLFGETGIANRLHGRGAGRQPQARAGHPPGRLRGPRRQRRLRGHGLGRDQVDLDPGTPLVGVAGCVSLDDALPRAVPGPTPRPTDTPRPPRTPAPGRPRADGVRQGPRSPALIPRSLRPPDRVGPPEG